MGEVIAQFHSRWCREPAVSGSSSDLFTYCPSSNGRTAVNRWI